MSHKIEEPAESADSSEEEISSEEQDSSEEVDPRLERIKRKLTLGPTNWIAHDFSKPFAMLICAPRNSGKTVLMLDLYRKYISRHVDLTIVFSGSLHTGQIQSVVGRAIFQKKYEPSVLEAAFAAQEKRHSEGKKTRILVILDDCLDNKTAYDASIRRLFTQGRHFGISLIWCTQTCSSSLIMPIHRMNTTIAILLKARNPSMTAVFAHDFLVPQISYDDKPRGFTGNDLKLAEFILRVNCINYNCVVIDLEKGGNRMRDSCSTYCATYRARP